MIKNFPKGKEPLLLLKLNISICATASHQPENCPEDVRLAKRIQTKIGQKNDICSGDAEVNSLNRFDIGTKEEDDVVVTKEVAKEGQDGVDNIATINNTTNDISDSVTMTTTTKNLPLLVERRLCKLSTNV